VDQNVSDSADVFLTLRRYDILQRRLQYPRDRRVGEVIQWLFETDGGITCQAWHLTFQRLHELLQASSGLKAKLEAEQEVNLISTRYRLEGPRLKSENEIQELIFNVAHHLVHEDGDMLPAACEWFRARGLDACRP